MDPKNRSERPLAPFFILWSGQALSLLGSQAVQFALIWWLTATTGSAAILATASILGLLPQIALGPFIGALVDRWNRKRILWFADAGVGAASGILALLFLTESASVGHVLVLLFVRAIGAGFHGPAMAASTSLMVPERHLTRIQGLNQSLQGGQLIVSAPLGALLYGLLPMAGVMAVDVVTALIAILPLTWIRVPQPERNDKPATGFASTWRDVVEGMRYLRARAGHGQLLGIGAVVNLCMVPAFSLLPLLVAEQGGAAMRLGGMNSLFGVGTIVGGLLLGIWGGFRTKIYTTLAGLVAAGAATLALGASPTLGPATFALAGLGVTIPLINGPILAVLQATVTPELQGRVFTLYASVCGMMAPLGLAVAAPIAELAGVRVWYAAGGLACLAMGLLGFFLPALLQIESVEPGLVPTGVEGAHAVEERLGEKRRALVHEALGVARSDS